MIICSCNVLTDHDVRSTLSGAEGARTAGEVHDRLGCSVQCGTLCPHNPPNLERGARRGQFRLPPNERRRLLARFTYDHGADWPLDWRVNAVGEGAALTDIAFEPVSSNRSLRCGETEFSGQRQRGRNGLGDSRTPVQRQNLARQLRQFGANPPSSGNSPLERECVVGPGVVEPQGQINHLEKVRAEIDSLRLGKQIKRPALTEIWRMSAVCTIALLRYPRLADRQ